MAMAGKAGARKKAPASHKKKGRGPSNKSKASKVGKLRRMH